MRRHTREERLLIGRAARQRVPREAHGAWKPAAGPPRPHRPARGAGRDRACRSSSPSATGAWRSRRSPSTGAGRSSWRPTSPPRRTPASSRSCAATLTSPTSACSRRPSGTCCSTSTTSTRRCRARGSGTSSGSRPASRWPAASWAYPARTGATWCSRRCVSTGATMRPASEMGVLEAWYSHLTADDVMDDGRRGGARRASRPQGGQVRRTSWWRRRAPACTGAPSTGSCTWWTASCASPPIRR